MPKSTALKWCLALAGIAAGVVLAWFAVRDIRWGGLAESLARVSWSALVPALVTVLVATVLQAVRWKLLLPGEAISTARLFFVRNAGLSVNNLALARGVLGEASELAMLTRSDSIDGSKVVASIFLARALDFLVTSAFLLAGFLAIPQLAGFKPVVAPVLALAALLLALVLFAGRVSRFPVLGRLKAVGTALRAVDALKARPARFWMSLSLTISASMLLGTAAWLVGQALGIRLPFWMMGILLVGINLMAGAIPSGPSGLGVYEFATMQVLGLFAVQKPDALAFGLVVHALVVLPSMAIGLPTLWHEQRAFKGLARQIGGLIGARLGRRAAPAP